MQTYAEKRDFGRLHHPRHELLHEAEHRGGGPRASGHRLCDGDVLTGDGYFSFVLFGYLFEYLAGFGYDQITVNDSFHLTLYGYLLDYIASS